MQGLITAAWVFFTLAMLVSVGAFVAKAKVFMRLLRSRRELGLGVAQPRSYFSTLKQKIAKAENQLTQTYWGCALAVLEDLPLGSIGIRFLVTKCASPRMAPVRLKCS